MAHHRKCKHCDFNLVWAYGYWEHKLRSRHCNKPEPKEKLKKYYVVKDG